MEKPVKQQYIMMVQVNNVQLTQQVNDVKIQQGNEEINSNGGNILIGKLISDIGLEKMNLQRTKRPNSVKESV